MIEQSKDVLEVVTVANDGPAMLKFYGETLGLTLRRSIEIPGKGKLHAFALGSNAIKVMVPLVRPEAKPKLGQLFDASGIRCVTIYVKNLDALIERCVLAGSKLLTPATDLPQLRVALLNDPDGNTLEFLELKEV